MKFRHKPTRQDYLDVIARVSGPHALSVRLLGQGPSFTLVMNSALGIDNRFPDSGALIKFDYSVDFTTDAVKPQDLLDVISRVWLEIRIHEAREELRVDGDVWMNPHTSEGLGHFCEAYDTPFGSDNSRFGFRSQTPYLANGFVPA